MRYVDLFAGLGGFNLALSSLGHQCVFASEIDGALRELYKKNFGIEAVGDLTQVDARDIPTHDILCAGFPCQPFSKARDYNGQSYAHLSDLYLHILRVIRYHQPKYLILENVPNLEWHDDGQTWERIEGLLRDEGYFVSLNKLSPHQFGIPQIRDRIYIVGSLSPLGGFKWPEQSQEEPSITNVLERNPVGARLLPDQVTRCLEVWQEFLDRVPKNEKIPHPLWSMEFGATYRFRHTTPWATTTKNLRGYRGSHGVNLNEVRERKDVFALLPSHARTEQTRFPDWKIKYIERNRDFYERHKGWLDDWIERIREFPSSFQKLEWNVQERDPSDEERHIRRYVIQIRPSGVRVKRKTTAPSLVAMTATQVPIIAWEGRYMTPTECKRLQSMEGIELPDSDTRAYGALGNAINVQVARLVAEMLVGSDHSTYGVPDELKAGSRVEAVRKLLNVGHVL